MILDEKYKFIRYNGSPTTQLFDMVEDPYETENLAPEKRYAAVCQRLADEIDRVEATLDNADIPENLLHPRA
jgi:arylsulfatase A-like enzyme